MKKEITEVIMSLLFLISLVLQMRKGTLHTGQYYTPGYTKLSKDSNISLSA